MQADTATALATAHTQPKQEGASLLAAGQPQEHAAMSTHAQEQSGNVLKIAPSRPKINRPPSKHITTVVDPLAEEVKPGLPKRSATVPPKQRQWDVKFAIGLIVLVVFINLSLTLLLGNQGDKQATNNSGDKVMTGNAVPVKKSPYPESASPRPVAPVAVKAPSEATAVENRNTVYTAPQATPAPQVATPVAIVPAPAASTETPAQSGRPGIDYPVSVVNPAATTPASAPSREVAPVATQPKHSASTVQAAPVTPAPVVTDIAPLPPMTAEVKPAPIAVQESFTPPPAVTVAIPVETVSPQPVAKTPSPMVAAPVAPTTPAPAASVSTSTKRPGIDYPVAIAPEAATQAVTPAAPAATKIPAKPVAAYAPENPAVGTYTRQPKETGTASEAIANDPKPVDVRSDEEKAQLLKIINQY